MDRLVALALATLILAAGCAIAAPVSRSSRDLHVDNGTTKAITVLVDGAIVSTVAASQSTTIPESSLPAGDWTVEARLPGGRRIFRGQIAPSAVSQTTDPNGGTTMTGSGQRADLSCGRLDVWVGIPMLGPYPGSGTPGDCDG